ncbi:MAG: hypothetical protein KVP17_005073 [Porospora cf. gigantea B]|uniref:uncharacterized protein n=1 Tax=Porospora cf. gigantea B TaxID=2853592 RepID=UPI003571A430|nr:MAG: hypothetical protein KVP17_005073 [Porospora cf. gigantea B]
MKLFSVFLLGVGLSCPPGVNKAPPKPPRLFLNSRAQDPPALDQQEDADDDPNYAPENIRKVSKKLIRQRLDIQNQARHEQARKKQRDDYAALMPTP